MNPMKKLLIVPCLVFFISIAHVHAQQAGAKDTLTTLQPERVNAAPLPDSDRLDFTNYTRLGGFLNGKEGCVSFNTSLMIRKFRKYDFGVGSGIEYYNRGLGFIQVMQAPVFLSNHIYVSRQLYFLFEPGIMIPLSGFYYTTYDEVAHEHEGKVELTNTDLKPAFYYNIGIGIYNSNRICFELVLRNQSNGILYPVHERINMVGLNMGIKL